MTTVPPSNEAAPTTGAAEALNEAPVETAASTLELRTNKEGDKSALARQVGALVAQRAKEKGIAAVVFDRGGNKYHGRIAALADGARESGLEF